MGCESSVCCRRFIKRCAWFRHAAERCELMGEARQTRRTEVLSVCQCIGGRPDKTAKTKFCQFCQCIGGCVEQSRQRAIWLAICQRVGVTRNVPRLLRCESSACRHRIIEDEGAHAARWGSFSVAS